MLIYVITSYSIHYTKLYDGARGNSGVILSLLFRGFAKGLADMKTAECDAIANSLKLGVEGAYKAVMKPTEGTILTVARLAAETAEQSATFTNDCTILWARITSYNVCYTKLLR